MPANCALLATLVRGGRGADDTSYLLVLGCRSPLDAGALSAFLDEAEARVRPEEGEGDRALEIVLPPPIAWMRALLKERGYADVYSYLTLVADVPAAVAADDDFGADVDASNVDATYACYRDAFLESSAPVSSPEEFRAALLGANPRPRVLFAEGEAAALLRVAWRDGGRGPGRAPLRLPQRPASRPSASGTGRSPKRSGSRAAWARRPSSSTSRRRTGPGWLCTTGGGFVAWRKRRSCGSRSPGRGRRRRASPNRPRCFRAPYGDHSRANGENKGDRVLCFGAFVS